MTMTACRPGKDTASELLTFRVTPEEGARIRALAAYLGMPYSDMLRRLAEEKRAQLVAEGKRPPLRKEL
jgi:hypothetical protein